MGTPRPQASAAGREGILHLPRKSGSKALFRLFGALGISDTVQYRTVFDTMKTYYEPLAAPLPHLAQPGRECKGGSDEHHRHLELQRGRRQDDHGRQPGYAVRQERQEGPADRPRPPSVGDRLLRALRRSRVHWAQLHIASLRERPRREGDP